MISWWLFIPEQQVEHKVITLVNNELKRQKNLLSSGHSACSMEEEEDDFIVREALLKITTYVLKKMNQKDLAKTLQKGKNYNRLCM